jgi:hypothetical protein
MERQNEMEQRVKFIFVAVLAMLSLIGMFGEMG